MILKVLKTRHVLTDIVIGERCFSDTIFSLLVADKLIFHCVFFNELSYLINDTKLTSSLRTEVREKLF